MDRLREHTAAGRELERHLRTAQRALAEEIDAHDVTRAQVADWRRQAYGFAAAMIAIAVVSAGAMVFDAADWRARIDVERRRGDYWHERAVELDPGEDVTGFYRRSRDWVRAR